MKRVLLVEDDLFLSDLYGQAMIKAGYQVKTASDAQAALDTLDKHKFDIVVLDIFLPLHNAFEIIQQLQSYGDWQKLPVILISSQRLSEQQLPDKLKRQLSVVNFLYKPEILPADVVEAVEAAKK